MKAGTIENMKFMVLRQQLRIPKYQAIGILEGLWYLTAASAKDGAIGRFSNLEIAAWLEWDGDPGDLVQALVTSGFIDESTKQRLVVHDWAEHAPNWIKGNMRRHGKGFAASEDDENEQPTKQGTQQPTKQPTKQAPMQPPMDAATKSSLVKSSQEETTLSGKPDLDLLGDETPQDKPNGKASLKQQSLEVLEFLNTKTGRKYQPVDANLKLITARLKEGATVADCRKVIAKKTREWGTDEIMAQYLRPATLFNATKFAQYVGELVMSPADTEAQH